jgi:hypothetical protein
MMPAVPRMPQLGARGALENLALPGARTREIRFRAPIQPSSGEGRPEARLVYWLGLPAAPLRIGPKSSQLSPVKRIICICSTGAYAGQ